MSQLDNRIVEVQIGGRPAMMPQEVGGCLKAAVQAIQQGNPEAAIERIAAAAVCDIQQHQETFLKGAHEAAVLAEMYEAAFQNAGLKTAAISNQIDVGKPLKVAYVISQVQHGQGPARRLTDMIERHDRNKINPSVFIAEELTQRTPPLNFLESPDSPSRVAGSEYIGRMNTAGVEPTIVPTDCSLIEAGRWLTEKLRDQSPDVTVFIASVASPVQAIAAYCGVSPIQINQNVAVPLPLNLIDGMIYHNAACAAYDKDVLIRKNIAPLVVPSVGTDIDAADEAEPIDRASMGIPDDAFVAVTASNKLQLRTMHGSFADDLGKFMREHHNVWWIGLGRGPHTQLKALLASLGVAGRVVLPGPVDNVRQYFKAADVYLNEYPEGGGNTNIEAMACKLVVAALRAGDRHTESIGAELVGEDLAVSTPSQYWECVLKWMQDPDQRELDSASLYQRVQERFGIDATCRSYERHYLQCVLERQHIAA